MKAAVTGITTIILLIVANHGIYQKERHLKEGRSLLLELAPVDPRSLMQGDYMALQFNIQRKASALIPKKSHDGYIIVHADAKNIAQFVRIDDPTQKVQNQDIKLRYRVRHGTMKFATNAFFFQEGMGKSYESARYGLFKVNHDGDLLLTSLYNDELKPLPLDPSAAK